MRSLAILLVSASLIATLPAAAARADDDDKLVRKIWFPRFSPDGKSLLTAHGGWDGKEGGEVRLFNAKDGTLQRVIAHPRGVRTVAWSSQGQFFITGDYGGDVRAFETRSGKLIKKIPYGKNANAENVRLTSDDKTLIVSYGSGDIRLFDLPGYDERYTFRATHKGGGIWGMAISPNDQYIASAGKDRFVNVADIKKNKIIHRLEHPRETNAVAFTPDNKYLATGGEDSRIRIFDVNTGEELAIYSGHVRNTVTDLVFTSDGKTLVSSGGDFTVRIWDTTNLTDAKLKLTLNGHTGSAFGVAISPDDSRVASVGWDEQVRMWSLKTDELIWNWKRE
jgi:WD40 repeat protein